MEQVLGAKLPYQAITSGRPLSMFVHSRLAFLVALGTYVVMVSRPVALSSVPRTTAAIFGW